MLEQLACGSTSYPRRRRKLDRLQLRVHYICMTQKTTGAASTPPPIENSFRSGPGSAGCMPQTRI